MKIQQSCSIFIRTLFTIAITVTAFNASATSSSTNYSIFWSSMSTGQASTSASYSLMSVPAQNTSGPSSSASYAHVAGFLAPPDTDKDAVKNFLDNCIEVANTDQRDTNSDGFGNICDPDFDGSLLVNAFDLFYMKSKFFTADPDADLNGDGIVNAFDLFRLKSYFFQPPGPSGIAP